MRKLKLLIIAIVVHFINFINFINFIQKSPNIKIKRFIIQFLYFLPPNQNQENMDNMENYVDIQVHNKIMQNLRERELQYKNKIIELQKQKQYEINRANQFQIKFKEALLQTGASNQQDLIENLSNKEDQNNNLRLEILKLKKLNDVLSQNKSNSNNPLQGSQIKQLINQNQQMAKTIQELKNAAISAIMSKDDQIQQLNEKISKAAQLALLYQNLLERQQTLQKQIQRLRIQAEQQQKSFSDKLTKERERYLQKIQQFQHNLQYQQSSKQRLLEKAQVLQNNLENKQQIIELYQNKIMQFESIFRQEKQNFQQEKQKFAIQIDNLKDRHLVYQKQISNFQKIVIEHKIKEKQFKIMNQRLKQQNLELQRKLTIKKRKNNPKLKSSDIYSSFQGISLKSSFYSSFYKPSEQTKPTTLGEIQQLQQNDVLESFIDLQQRAQQETQKIIVPNLSKKKQKSQEIQISSTQIFGEKVSKEKIEQVQQKSVHQKLNQSQAAIADQKQREQSRIPQQIKQKQTQTINKAQLQQLIKQKGQLKKKLEHSSAQIQNLNKKIQLKSLQLENEKQNNAQSINVLNQKAETLKKKLQESYSELQRLTRQLSLKTEEIKKQRQSLAQLRSQNKKSQSQKEMIVEFQNFKQHVFKLQNALLIQKLQNAQKQQFMKQRNQRQKHSYQEKINRLNEEVKSLSPKKKKGFFR